MKDNGQVYLCSTEDLKEDQIITSNILIKLNFSPYSIEDSILRRYGSSSKIIKDDIDRSDCVLILIGGKYGDVDEETGLSYTRIAYEYAVAQNIPLIVFIKNLFVDDIESDIIKRKKLKDFKSLARKNSLCILYKNIEKTSHIIHSSIVNKFVKIRDSSFKKEDNTKEFIEKQIADYKLKEESLKNELNSIKDSHKAEVEEKQVLIEETQLELDRNKKIIENYKKELYYVKSQEDIEKKWENKITVSFESLSKILEPIKKEHTRIKWQYNISVFLTIIIVLCIMLLGYHIFNKLLGSEYGSFDIKQFIPFYTPLPISAGLLWLFIYQMNRSQRQLVFLAEYIHSIQYTEGLLKALNTLSSDIESSKSRINAAIDKLINNHLNRSNTYSLKEDSLKKLEKKDENIDIDKTIDLLKCVKDMLK